MPGTMDHDLVNTARPGVVQHASPEVLMAGVKAATEMGEVLETMHARFDRASKVRAASSQPGDDLDLRVGPDADGTPTVWLVRGREDWDRVISIKDMHSSTFNGGIFRCREKGIEERLWRDLTHDYRIADVCMENGCAVLVDDTGDLCVDHDLELLRDQAAADQHEQDVLDDHGRHEERLLVDAEDGGL